MMWDFPKSNNNQTNNNKMYMHFKKLHVSATASQNRTTSHTVSHLNYLFYWPRTGLLNLFGRELDDVVPFPGNIEKG